jgi:GMP synthase PP-ATPase subunit
MTRRTKNELRIVAEYIEVDGQLVQVDPKDVPGLPVRCRAAVISWETGIPLGRIEITEDKILVYVETEEESERLRLHKASRR